MLEFRNPSWLLRRVDAPSGVIAWASESGSVDELWDACHRGDWLIWLGVIEGVPAVAIVEAAVACARRGVMALPRGEERRLLTRALRAARELASSELCDKRAKRCEKLAGDLDDAEGSPTSLQWAASSAACATRAAEALLAAEARRSAARDHESMTRAAGIGAGDQIISRGDFPPLVFDRNDDLMAMCAHAAETAVARAALALTARSGEEGPAQELAEIVFDILDPVRRGMREGEPIESLVRSVCAEPHGSSAATRQRTRSELNEIDLGRRPWSVVAGTLLVTLLIAILIGLIRA